MTQLNHFLSASYNTYTTSCDILAQKRVEAEGKGKQGTWFLSHIHSLIKIRIYEVYFLI